MPSLDYPTEAEIRWLFRQRISDAAMLEPTHLRADKVTFLDQRTFDFDPEGERVLVFEEQDDLVAWKPSTGELGTWCGRAFALNGEAIWNPASYFMGSGLRVHRTPLEWLRADRDGIVIVQPGLAHAMLHLCQRLAFDDASHARQVRDWMQPPRLEVQFLVSNSRREAIAA